MTTNEIFYEALRTVLEAVLEIDNCPHVNEVGVKIEKRDDVFVLTFNAWAHSERIESNSLGSLIEAVKACDPNKKEAARRQQRIVELQNELAALQPKESL